MTDLHWKEIEGYLSDAEAAFLQFICKDKCVLEVGAYHGKSTCVIAEVCAHLTTVDLSTYEWSKEFGDVVKADFLNNISKYKNIEYFIDDSTKLLPKMIDFGLTFDVIFIDGCHDRPIVLNDLFNSLFLTRDAESLIACHDYYNTEYSDIKRVVDVFVPTVDYTANSIVAFKRKSVRI
jgi:predicted O-methyltransferase YrrM